MSEHRELLCCVGSGQYPARSRIHDDLLTGGCSVAIGVGTFGNPSLQDLEGRVGRSQPLAAHVRHSQQRLLQHQALQRSEDVDPAIESTANQRFGVVHRIESEQRQAETALAIRRSMATAGVAPLLGHRRQRLVLEPHRVRTRLATDHNGHFYRLVLPHHFQLGLPINTFIRRTHSTVADRHQSRFARTHGGPVCHIPQPPVSRARGDHQLDAAATRGQPHRLGIDLHGCLHRRGPKTPRDRNQTDTPQHVVSPAGFLAHNCLRTVRRWVARAGTTESADRRACKSACDGQCPVSRRPSPRSPRS